MKIVVDVLADHRRASIAGTLADRMARRHVLEGPEE
jgi:hypothetical protein